MKFLRTSVPAAVLAAAGLLMTAPQAAADIGVYVTPGVGNGFGTGCTYWVTATGTASYYVAFYDNGEWFGGADQHPTPTSAATRWTPKTTGQHVISARQFTDGSVGEWAYTTVDVRTGINLGSACPVI